MYPEYYELIKFPMDLTTFKKKIPSYPNLSSALQDLRLIWKNCLQFNLENSEIAQQALRLGKDVEKLIEVSYLNTYL
jgi:histone acetyltransferase